MVSNDSLLPNYAEQGAPEGAIPFAAEQLLEVDKDDDVDKKTGISERSEINVWHKPSAY
jgi:hypothetical protein